MATSQTILGVTIDPLTMQQASDLIIKQAQTKGGQASYVVKPYVEFFDRAHRDADIRTLLNQAWLRLPEGVSTQWAAAYLQGPPSLMRAVRLAVSIVANPKAISKPIPEKFGGTVFTWKLLEACSAQGLRVYLIGSPRGNEIEITAQTIRRHLPQLEITGTWPGQWGGMSGEQLRQRLRTAPIEAKVLADIMERKPDIILVAMGFPLQEELMAKLAPQLPGGVLIGEGGTFDYESFGGTRAKAPTFIQRIGLEWLWRLVLEPSRWKRQLAVPRFMWKVYRESQAPAKTLSSRS